MKKENKNKEEIEELCCVDKKTCSIDCALKKDSSESKCGCGGNC